MKSACVKGDRDVDCSKRNCRTCEFNYYSPNNINERKMGKMVILAVLDRLGEIKFFIDECRNRGFIITKGNGFNHFVVEGVTIIVRSSISNIRGARADAVVGDIDDVDWKVITCRSHYKGLAENIRTMDNLMNILGMRKKLRTGEAKVFLTMENTDTELLQKMAVDTLYTYSESEAQKE